MSIARIASRYAKSLIQLAQEQQLLDLVMEDINLLRKLTKNRDFYLLLKSPVIPDHKKIAVVEQLVKDKIQDLTLKFFILLIQKQRSAYLPEIIEEFIDQYKDIRNINTVTVSSAQALSPVLLDSIKQRMRDIGLATGQIELVERIDPSLIGGFVLEYKDFIFDASVAQQLADLKKNYFEENLYKSKIMVR